MQRRNHIIDKKTDRLHLSRFKSLLFSDNILFFAPYEDEVDMGNLYMNLLYGLSEFLVQYNKGDIFFRGGIAKGNLYYDEKLHFVFGSGLVKAHDLENKIAKYPRIVLDENLNPSSILTGINQDNENVWYLDYLSLGYNLICNQNRPQRNYEQFLSCLDEQKDAIIRAYNKYKDDQRIFPKYQWLAKYHNSFCIKQGFVNCVIEIE